jgi:ribonuclease E
MTPGTTVIAYVGRRTPRTWRSGGALGGPPRRTGTCSLHYRIDEQMAKALDRKVYLPSGGSLVIDRTEAMTVVDVNTGKFTGRAATSRRRSPSNNLEAAEEIVRQLRLRDLGGIIVIDFIDMVLESNRDLCCAAWSSAWGPRPTRTRWPRSPRSGWCR